MVSLLAYWEKDPQKIVPNLMELKPTFFPSVPRIFEKIHTLATSAGDARELEQATRVGIGGAAGAASRRGGPGRPAGGVRARRAGPLCQRSQPVRRCRRDRAVIAVRKLARLRRPGRPRRVKQQAPGLRRDTVEALLKLGLRPPPPPLAQRSKRDRPLVGVRRVDHDHELERRQVSLNGADLRQLLGVLDEHRPRPGVMQHVVALLRRVRLVDRHDNRASGKRRKTRVGPLRPRMRQDRNPVSRLDPQIDEPKRQLPHHPLELLIGVIMRPGGPAQSG